jgi:hypothetical protein
MSGRARADADGRRPASAPRRAAPNAMPSPVEKVLAQPGQPLDSDLQRSLGARLGHDFSRVRVHTDSAAARSAEALNAAAYAAGPHLVFGSGRFEPKTPRGERLLLHELGHSLHQASAGQIRGGVGPGDALAERGADRFADRAMGGESKSRSASFHGWGPAWQLHAQSVTQAGTSVFKEERLGLQPDVFGPPVGIVEVRTGAEVSLGKGAVESNLISIGYQGALSADSKWLQFVWFELTAETPSGLATLAGTVPTSSGAIATTTNPASPNWAVDSGTNNHFYESGAVAIRTSEATTMFDRPGDLSAAPLARTAFAAGIGATVVTFAAHFETFLVQKDVAIYHVPWSARTVFTRVGNKMGMTPVAYALGAHGNVSGLPANLKKLLHSQYPAFGSIR